MNIGPKVHIFGLFCAYLFIWAGCGQNGDSEGSQATIMIQDLAIKPSENHVELYETVLKICDQIRTEDPSNKATQYRELAKRLASFDFLKLDSGDRVLVFGDYWRSLALLCAKMADEGSLTPESFAILLNGWESCHDMCNLQSSDNIPEAAVMVQTRGNRRKLCAMFENDAALFERDILRLIFKSHNIDAKQQSKLYAMWHRRFGCRVKSHSEYQGK